MMTKEGEKVMASMMDKYGKRGKKIFYATMKKKGMEKDWEGMAKAMKSKIKKS